MQIGVHPLTVVNWEGNATTPTCQYTKAILDFLGYLSNDVGRVKEIFVRFFLPSDTPMH